MLSDFYGALADTSFPSIEEIREVMQDEDKEAAINGVIRIHKKLAFVFIFKKFKFPSLFRR